MRSQKEQKVKTSREIREEHIAVALRMVKKGNFTIDQIVLASSLSHDEVQGLIDNTRSRLMPMSHD